MHVVIELWQAKPAFTSATAEERKTFFDSVGQNMVKMKEAGIETLGWGTVDGAVDFGADFTWFAVWTMPGAEQARAFLGGVAASPWYVWFEQVNVVGELRSVDQVIAEHVEYSTVTA